MDISKRKKKMINQLSKQDNSHLKEIVVAKLATNVSKFDMFHDQNIIEKKFGKDVNIIENEALLSYIVEEKITVQDLIDYIKSLNDEIETRIKENQESYIKSNYYSNWPEKYESLPNPAASAKQYQAEFVEEYPKNKLPELKIQEFKTQPYSNVFNMLDFKD